MALYTRDNTMFEAKKCIDSLSDNAQNILIKYYIDKKQDETDELKKQLEEYREWFKTLDKFLPNKNIVFG